MSTECRTELTVQEKISFAKKARRLSSERFDEFCQSNGLTSEQLALWVDSFEAGGEMGIRALDETLEPPEEEMVRAISVIRLYLEYKFPQQKFDIKRRKNKLTIGTLNRSVTPSGTESCEQIIQIRYFETKSKKTLWLLYWYRSDGRWWPYITQKQRIYNIDQIMEEVDDDPQRCFWFKDETR